MINDKHALTVGINNIVFVNMPTFEIYLYANILGYFDLYYVLKISYKIKQIFIKYNMNINIKKASSATPPIERHIPLNYMNSNIFWTIYKTYNGHRPLNVGWIA